MVNAVVECKFSVIGSPFSQKTVVKRINREKRILFRVRNTGQNIDITPQAIEPPQGSSKSIKGIAAVDANTIWIYHTKSLLQQI
jgi:hypothetical protein